MPQMTARRLGEERLQRTIFTAVRATAAEAPAVRAVREALRDASRTL